MADTHWLEGAVIGPNAVVPLSYVFPWAETATITTSDNTDVTLYRKGDRTETDVADTYFGASPTHSYAGNKITLSNISGLQGGETYILSIAPTVDGVQDQWFQEIKVPKTATGRA